jgi:hypothetical protein
VNVNDERARLAAEVGTMARSLSRLADLASVLEAGSAEVNIDQLNELAGRMHRWSLEMAKDLDRPALTDELQQRQQAFVDWRDLQERVRARSRLRNN